MDKYAVKLYARAYRDLDGIYEYIANNLSEPMVASNMIDTLEEAIYSLEYLPERGAIRRIGAYANGDYRQLFVKRYIIVYRVLKERSTYRHSAICAESILKFNMFLQKGSPQKGCLFRLERSNF